MPVLLLLRVGEGVEGGRLLRDGTAAAAAVHGTHCRRRRSKSSRFFCLLETRPGEDVSRKGSGCSRVQRGGEVFEPMSRKAEACFEKTLRPRGGSIFCLFFCFSLTFFSKSCPGATRVQDRDFAFFFF